VLPLPETKSAASVAPVLASIREKMGKVFNFHGTLAHNEAAFNAFMAYDQALDAAGTLSVPEREAIAFAISESNRSRYCVAAHAMVSKMMGLSEDDVLGLRTGTPTDRRLGALSA
jgi:AhpD family alkylhydroperoxidase